MRKWYGIQIPVSLSKAAGTQPCWTLSVRGRACKAQKTVRRLLAPSPRCTPGSNSPLRTEKVLVGIHGGGEKRHPTTSHAQVQRRVLSQRAGELGLPGLAFTPKTPNPCSACAFRLTHRPGPWTSPPIAALCWVWGSRRPPTPAASGLPREG